MFRVTSITSRSLALTAALALSLGGACSSDEGSADDGNPADRPEGDADGEAGAEAPFASGHRTLTLVDTDRTTDAVPGSLPERPDRTLVVDVVYPAEGEPGPEPTGDVAAGAAVVDAPPVEGAFPLVVFAHGWNGRADHYLGFAERWARAGYVVALPTFPISQEGIGADDLAAQPGDVSFVIDELATLDDDDPLAGRVDVDRVAVGGHSLGAATVFGVAYNSCCLDERIDATIPVAGGTLPIDGGDYEDRPATPMLLVHGARDPAVPVAAGDAMFELAEPPVWYLRPAEADHVSVFAGEAGQVFDEAVLAFLDAELRGGDTAALDAVGAEVVSSGHGEWRTKPPAT